MLKKTQREVKVTKLRLKNYFKKSIFKINFHVRLNIHTSRYLFIINIKNKRKKQNRYI